MDVSRQVLKRSARMGIMYVIMGVVLAVFMTAIFDVVSRLGTTAQAQGQNVDVAAAVGFIVIPMIALAGLIVTSPVYLLFVSDKNEGVLEYLLAVGMSQREVFEGYLKAALMLSMVAILPAVVLNIVLSPSGLQSGTVIGALAMTTGLADVAFVTVLMTGFSSMQRKPTGMNSPLGTGIGIFILLPELILFSVVGTAIIWLDFGIAMTILALALVLLFSLDRFIRREKFLP